MVLTVYVFLRVLGIDVGHVRCPLVGEDTGVTRTGPVIPAQTS